SAYFNDTATTSTYTLSLHDALPIWNHTIPTPGFADADTDRNLDWYSKVEAWIRFTATADSDFGPAKAVIKIKDLQEWKAVNETPDRKSTRLNSSHVKISYAVFCLKK